ncbi:hypothetical protein DTO063F5_7113 [Paecilomyces variotii]|nr:hypothetical protein DTO063F5_7113 [Paecilomyces variotii]
MRCLCVCRCLVPRFWSFHQSGRSSIDTSSGSPDYTPRAERSGSDHQQSRGSDSFLSYRNIVIRLGVCVLIVLDGLGLVSCPRGLLYMR